MPKNNREWWQDKLTRNVERDRDKDEQLDKLGWVAVHIWEHENPIQAADVVEKLWRDRRKPAPRRAAMIPRPPVL